MNTSSLIHERLDNIDRHGQLRNVAHAPWEYGAGGFRNPGTARALGGPANKLRSHFYKPGRITGLWNLMSHGPISNPGKAAARSKARVGAKLECLQLESARSASTKPRFNKIQHLAICLFAGPPRARAVPGFLKSPAPSSHGAWAPFRNCPCRPLLPNRFMD